MTDVAQRHGSGYGVGSYGIGGYGNPKSDTMTDAEFNIQATVTSDDESIHDFIDARIANALDEYDLDEGEGIDREKLAEEVAALLDLSEPIPEERIQEIVREAIDEHAPDREHVDPGEIFEALEADIRQMIVEHAEAQIDYGRLADEVAERLDIGEGSGGLGEARLARIDAMLERLELSIKPSNEWRIGPESPSGSYHSNPLWGAHFSTDRHIRLGRAYIESNQPAEFTVRLYEYEAGEIRGVADETTIAANGTADQRVLLDLHAGSGEYLLARPVYDERHDRDEYAGLPDEAFVDEPAGCALRRVHPNDHSAEQWDEYSDNGVTFFGTDNAVFSSNTGYYYWFDLEIATGPDAETETETESVSEEE